MPKISIVIPIYNVENYLPACLDSVIAQTFTDWEAICVNDGSPDKCGEILDKYTQKDSRIKVITQENQGVSVARNAALKASEGDYICFLDSDDELAPTFLEKMYDSVTRNGADVVWCDYQQGTEKKNWSTQNTEEKTYTDIFHRFLTENPQMGMCIWNKIYTKKILKGLKFSEETGIGEDLVFLYQALYQAKTVTHLPMQLYFYRTRKDSAMNSGLSKKIILGNIKTAELISSYFKDKELLPKTRKILDQKIAKRIFKFAVLEPKRKDKNHLNEWYKITRPLLAKLLQQKVYSPRYLPFKNRFKSWYFLKKLD